jgi:hypothetical protein
VCLNRWVSGCPQSAGFGFLGFPIQWRRMPGTKDKRHGYTFIAARPVRQSKDKTRDLTPRTSQTNPRDLPITIARRRIRGIPAPVACAWRSPEPG